MCLTDTYVRLLIIVVGVSVFTVYSLFVVVLVFISAWNGLCCVGVR